MPPLTQAAPCGIIAAVEERTRADVESAVRAQFSPKVQSKVLEILDLFETEHGEGARCRVHLAILKLSGGDVEKLLHFTEAAIADFRDVLLWAERENG